ncbi:hypothetical protein GJ496_001852 [Pomphorhynchus laevis]|nr:hypothetical protein GJ496_001852 [Pomphorhynchus laevis]
MRANECTTSGLSRFRGNIHDRFLSIVTGHDLNDEWFTLLTSPLNLSGIEIVDPLHASSIEFKRPQTLCDSYDLGLYDISVRQHQSLILREISSRRMDACTRRLEVVINHFSDVRTVIDQAFTCDASS